MRYINSVFNSNNEPLLIYFDKDYKKYKKLVCKSIKERHNGFALNYCFQSIELFT